MNAQNTVFRKNFSLIVAFLVLTSLTLIIGLVVAYQLTARNIESQFVSKKTDVADQTIGPYIDLYKNMIFEISVYSGLLDSSSAAYYADSVFHNYPFVDKLVFFQILVRSRGRYIGNNLKIVGRSVFEYYPHKKKLQK